MYSFSASSDIKLSECHKDIQIVCSYLINYIDFTVVTGYRSPEEQREKYNEGLSEVLVSKHNKKPSEAVDIAPYPIDWADHRRFYYLAGMFMGIAKALKSAGIIESEFRFGGDWDKDGEIADNKFNDLLHFEIV